MGHRQSTRHRQFLPQKRRPVERLAGLFCARDQRALFQSVRLQAGQTLGGTSFPRSSLRGIQACPQRLQRKGSVCSAISIILCLRAVGGNPCGILAFVPPHGLSVFRDFRFGES